jgi:nucleoside-diphosphate-sugar epimerase
MSVMKTVCVTGGSGFLGSWCVKTLLERGYKVHTSVRSAAKASFLNSLEGASENLTIFSGVDLLQSGAFNECISGCDAVLHTASPFFFEGGTEESLVKPALEGTRNVLTTCKELGIKRVVLTSSTAAVYATYGTLPDDHVYDENTWSPRDVLREKGNWYCLSKTLAEELAWEMSKAEDSPFQLATINPCMILGPQLPGQPHLNTSSASMLGFMDGSMNEIPNSCRAFVDVRDCAIAHVNALERWDVAAGRRFLLIASSPHWTEVADIVRECLPEELKKNVPTTLSSVIPPVTLGNPPPNPTLFDNSPSREILGIDYRMNTEMISTAVETLLANGFNSSSQYSKDKL